MNAHDIENLRKKLERLQKQLQVSLAHRHEETFRGVGGESSGGISDTPIHPADLGSDNAEMDVELTLLGNEEHLMLEVNSALTRIAENRFGKCETCGEPIAQRRLDATPYVRNCIRCARAAEAPP
jgi:RNA polymerase-binding protein DksA